MAKNHYLWSKKPILLPITIIFVYIWDELRATNGNLYNKMGSEEGLSGFSWFLAFFSVVFLSNFGRKISFFPVKYPQNDPQW